LSVNRILVVDDDPSMRFLLRLIFENSGYDVNEAQNGVTALIKIKDVLPDLIVTDMMMPVMAGGALIGHLRSDPRTAGLRIPAVTADPDAKKAAASANVVLAKPFIQSTLLASVSSLLGEERLEALIEARSLLQQPELAVREPRETALIRSFGSHLRTTVWRSRLTGRHCSLSAVRQ
jgi:CheY-like chemotaxis protein